MDAETIRKACKGFGTDEKALHRVLCNKPAEQMEVLQEAYKRKFGKDLISLLKSELSGHHEATLCALVSGPLMYDIEWLNMSVAGAGTKESVVTEVLVGRSG